jgi:hypothetical protein
MMRYCITFMSGVAALVIWSGGLNAGMIAVPNGSFESPATPYVSVNINSWQKSAMPVWYDETGGFLWSYNLGIFKNTATNSPDYIDNCDGNQAMWLFAVPEVAIFQDYDSTNWSSPVPTHAFDAKFEMGKSCQLTVGVVPVGGMLPGATLQLSLYYRDAASNQVTVAATSITNTPSIFTNTTHLLDFHVTVPMVTPGDPWAGQHIGIQMLSTVDTNHQGGYWDLDNIRLSSILEPAVSDPVCTNGQFQFTLRSEPGIGVEIIATTNLTLPMSQWSSLGTLTNEMEAVAVRDRVMDSNAQFYRARRLPQPGG